MWFNQPFMREKFREGQHVLLSRQAEDARADVGDVAPASDVAGRTRRTSPRCELLPLYPLTEGLTQYHMRRMVASGVERLRPACWKKCFPTALLAASTI